MTRKEELVQRAKETTEQILAEGVCLSNGECVITDRVILQALKQVEREVWQKVIDRLLPCCSLVSRPGVKDSVMICRESEWAEAQQKELG